MPLSSIPTKPTIDGSPISPIITMSARNSAAINILVVDNPRSSPAPCWNSVKVKYAGGSSSSDPSKARTGETTLHDNTGIQRFKLGNAASGRTYNILDATQVGTDYEELLAAQSISDIKGVVFVANCGAYDPMFEDSTSAALNEDVALFSSICHAGWAKDARLVLWVDGRAAFGKKVEALDLAKFFAEYGGGTDMSKFIENVPKRFEKLGQDFGKETYSLYVEEDSRAKARPGPIDHLMLLLKDFTWDG